jgi:flagellar basal body rod protein FlgC
MSIGQTQALQGLQTSQKQFDQAASKIAQSPFSSAAPQGDLVDLSTQAVALLQSKNSFEANIQVLKVDNQMQQALLNVVG